MSKKIKKDSKMKDKTFIENVVFDNRILTKDEVKFYFSKMHTFEIPKENESYHFVTNRKFSAIEIIEEILKDDNAICSECVIAIYSINQKAAEKFIDLYEVGKIKKLTFLFSTMRRTSTRKKDLENVYSKLHSYGKFKIGYFSSHAKIIAMKTNIGDFAIEMSCNFYSNSKIENVTITNNSKLTNLHAETINKIIDFGNDAK